MSLISAQEGPLKVMLHMDYGTMSHVKHLFEVSSILRDRNHTIVYAVAESYQKYNAGYDFQVVSLGRSFDDSDHLTKQMTMYHGNRQAGDAGELLDSLGHVFVSSYRSIYPRLSEAVEQERPDVMICDFFSPACRDVALMKGVPLISGFQCIDIFGIANSNSITHSMGYTSLTTEKLSFTQRFIDKVFIKARMSNKLLPYIKEMNLIRNKFNVPPSSTILGDFSTTLGIASTFFGFEAAIDIPPNLSLIGPIKATSSTPITPELHSFLNSHPRTIYIGFGSLSILSQEDIIKILTAALLAKTNNVIDGVIWAQGRTSIVTFPKTISFNHSEESIFNHPHIKILPWAPQSAILNHNSTKLFISHVGLESSIDAIFSKTPVLCIPIFGDQPRNARKLVDAGIGFYIDRILATPDSIAAQIHQILQDPHGTIQANLARMKVLAEAGSRRKYYGADLIEEYAYTAKICRPTNPHRPGEIPCEAKHLIPPTRNMSFITANLIDVYLAAAFILATAAVILVYLARIGCTRLLKLSRNALPKKKDE